MLNRQRQVVYGERREVLEGADLHEQIVEMINEVVADYAAGETSEGYPEEWDLDKLWRAFRQLFPIGISVDDVVDEAGGERAGLSAELITDLVVNDAQAAYERREEEFGSEVMRELERRVVLSVLDRKWREHLYEMDYLREGIGLRGYGQRDPLVEYQREGYDMFNAMMEGIKEESVGNLFNLQIQIQENPIVEEAADGAAAPGVEGAAGAPGLPGVPAQGTPAWPGPVPPARTATGGTANGGAAAGGPAAGGRTPAAGGTPRAPGAPAARGPQAPRDGRQSGQAQGGTPGRTGGAHARPAGAPAAPVPAGLAPRQPQRLQYSAPSIDGGSHVETSRGPAGTDDFAHVGRNDPCPCGSGRKFKRCHGDPRMRPEG